MTDWKEEFRKEFPNKIAGVIDDFGDTTKNDIELFINHLRNKDKEELIKMLPKENNGFGLYSVEDIAYNDGCNKAVKEVKQLITDYYNK